MKSSTLLSIDAFSRAQDDIRIRTKSGAIITISCIAVTVILLINQWLQFQYSISTITNLVVDRERNLKLNLDFDITFTNLPCNLINIDILDDASFLQSIIDPDSSSFTKIRIDRSSGKPISSSEFNLNEKTYEYPPDDENYCGPCYGAKDQSINDKEGIKKEDRVCCQTCSDVKNSYLDAGWAFFDGKNIEQCEREGYIEKINSQLNEGCQIKGSNVLINRVNGNLHFAPGEAYHNPNGHYHDTSFYDLKPQLNFNHIINHFSFGNGAVDRDATHDTTLMNSPLDGTQVLPEYDSHAYAFTYFNKIVSTRYEYLERDPLETVQFTSMFHDRQINGGNDIHDEKIKHARGGIPGLFIYFDISPMKIINKEQHTVNWSTFVLNCITSIGGILAVGTVIDKIFYKTQRTFFTSENKKE
ncbi:hypothetical protein KAFR_0C05060 [Kazachstania africana CBS 2517]|uniref:Endoplasmic reticulum-Golgi intermediate compartment protein n=1 Tax=Kazachstania africana (strain ATCC 22294 / BCRC 22015 / CBS 2517 / CECT 1963 / NBRC 1671 / NRRL Y-8276) TaxID=1071382 RepID=H2ASZ7_KAZAF|nr:hypothetical protein KAFR_0C05060 [Kazachstania africana CBS 2517]CCF57497.1 hypothetical protein KAFR_0C05060 [Kazachstania africana CBS 2517]